MVEKGTVGVMSKPLGMAIFTVALLLSGLACQQSGGEIGGAAAPPAAGFSASTESSTLAELAEDIRLLGLLNRLQLEAGQINDLLPLVAQLCQARERLEAENTSLRQQLVQALGEKVNLLLQDKPIPQKLEERSYSLQSQYYGAQENVQTTLTTQAAGLRQVLSEAQLAIVSGKYEAELQGGEMLDWLRTLSESDYTDEAQANAEGLADPEKGLDEDLLLNLFHTAREMTEKQYLQSRSELAERLAPLYGLSDERTNQQLAKLFSSPRMTYLLREKLKILAPGEG